MSFQLRALADMRQLRLERKVPSRKDASSLDVSLRWGYSTDLLDPTPFLDGHELILTTAQQLLTGDGTLETRCRIYVDRLAEGNVAGIVYTLAQPDRELSIALRDVCRTVSMPLFEAPFDVPFLRIAEAIAERNDATAQANASHVAHAQHALTLAGLAVDPVTAIVRELAVLTGHQVSVENSQGQQIAQSPGQAIGELQFDMSRARRVPLGIGGRLNGQLIVAPAFDRFAGGRTPAGGAATVTSSRTGRSASQTDGPMINLAAAMLHLAIGGHDRVAADFLRQRAIEAAEDGHPQHLLSIVQELAGEPLTFPVRVVAEGRQPRTLRAQQRERSMVDGDHREVTCSLGTGAHRVVLNWSLGQPATSSQQAHTRARQPTWHARTPAELVLACRGAWARATGGEMNASQSSTASQSSNATQSSTVSSDIWLPSDAEQLPYLRSLRASIASDPLLSELVREQGELVHQTLGVQAARIVQMFVTWVDVGCSWNTAARASGVHRTTVERQVRQFADAFDVKVLTDGEVRQWAYLMCRCQ